MCVVDLCKDDEVQEQHSDVARTLRDLLRLRDLVLQDNPPPYGICRFLEETCFNEEGKDFIQLQFNKWQHFSGNLIFPVPWAKGVKDDDMAQRMYWDCADDMTMWVGGPGVLRMDLLEFLIRTAMTELGRADEYTRLLPEVDDYDPKQKLLVALRHIRNYHNRPIYRTSGICEALGIHGCNGISRTRYFRSWPKFSGSGIFPVPDPATEKWWYRLLGVFFKRFNKRANSGNLFCDAVRLYGSMWTGKYGALRLELLDHVIECVESELFTKRVIESVQVKLEANQE